MQVSCSTYNVLKRSSGLCIFFFFGPSKVAKYFIFKCFFKAINIVYATSCGAKHSHDIHPAMVLYSYITKGAGKRIKWQVTSYFYSAAFTF